jgi:hypothetical protein
MEFTLVYRGELDSNGPLKQKQEIRRVFHKQLCEFWKEAVITDLSNPSRDGLFHKVGSFRFFPLVMGGRREVAELEILLLRPEPIGRLIVQGGDIDNRLKTLFDALRMPKTVDEISKGDSPSSGEDPFFCLLEDDSLISAVSVSTDRLLEPGVEKKFVQLLIKVRIKKLPIIGANMMLTVSRI